MIMKRQSIRAMWLGLMVVGAQQFVQIGGEQLLLRMEAPNNSGDWCFTPRVRQNASERSGPGNGDEGSKDRGESHRHCPICQLYGHEKAIAKADATLPAAHFYPLNSPRYYGQTWQSRIVILGYLIRGPPVTGGKIS